MKNRIRIKLVMLALALLLQAVPLAAYPLDVQASGSIAQGRGK